MRLGLVAVALLVIVGASAAARPGSQTYVDERYGWQVRYPSRFHLERIAIDGRYSYRGASISNFRAALRHDPRASLRLPRRGVVVRFWTWNGPPRISADEAALPLSLASFVATPGLGGVRSLSFQAGGVSLWAAVWIGSRVSERDRADLARIIASFRPRPIREGWLEPDRNALVLERDRSFSVRSVRRYDPGVARPGFVRAGAFYLVRAPRAFYALSAEQTLAAGPTRCAVRFDPRRFEFFCPNGDRWDRLGRVIRYAHSRGRSSERLAARLVTLAFDGHVLVWTGTIAVPPRNAWP